MAPMKRKEGRDVGDRRPGKKQRTSSTTPTILKEEPAFPRGGANILTPLEQRQIQIQANQDVLFEQNTGKRISHPEFEDAENEEDTLTAASNGKSKARNRGKVRKKSGLASESTKATVVKIEGLSYKRLIPGSLVLGQVTQITKDDIALSLPNNLTGYVPLTAMSDAITQKLQALTQDDEMIDSGEEGDLPLDLSSMFFIGQYLRAYVVSTETEAGITSKAKRHISLSINPRQTNAGLSIRDLASSSTIQASVLSVEDHGFRMDLGLGDETVHGFVALKDAGKDLETAKVQEGQTFLCLVTGQNASGKTFKLSIDPAKIGNIKKGSFMMDAPSVDSLLPGTAVEFLITENEGTGLVGKVMGLLDVTADLFHSGVTNQNADLKKRFPTGSKTKGRIISTFPTSEAKKLGVSLQNHLLDWRPYPASKATHSNQECLTDRLPISSIIEKATVRRVEPSLGLFFDVGISGVNGFAHISCLTDGKIDSLSEDSGSFKLGSTHKARVIHYNALDGLFILSLEPKVLNQPFLALKDVNVGQIVKGTIERLIITEAGMNGLIVNVAEGISGLVPETHFADIRLQHPERKFREGGSVTARVLSIDLSNRQMRLTLKKTLVNSETTPWTVFEGLKVDMKSPGTLLKVSADGAVVQFYGRVRAFLPKSEMSESYIQDPREHFRSGQVVNVRIVTIDASNQRLTVSCKDPLIRGQAELEALESLQLGTVMEGVVREKTNDSLTIELQGGIRAMLPIEHLTDGSQQKAKSAVERIRIDQTLKQLVMMSKDVSRHRVRLSNKPSLIAAASTGKLPHRFEDIEVGADVVGYVNNITSIGVFVKFAGELSALLLKRHIPEEAIVLQDYGMRRGQTVKARVLSVDNDEEKFLLTMKSDNNQIAKASSAVADVQLSNPIDENAVKPEDFTLGKVTKAKINAIKDTQLNVQLADGVQGRIDISSIFDKWEDIKNKKHPLKAFHARQILPVRILGMHDSRNHRFLPITHRTKAPVFELTAKSSDLNASELDLLTLDKVNADSSWVVFVNKVSENSLWVNLTPNIRGRIKASYASDDVNVATDLVRAFPIGSALQATVIKVDVENNRLDLSARASTPSASLSLKDISIGQVLPGRVTKVTDRQIIVQLSDHVSAPVHLVDMADDFSKASPWNFTRDQVVRVCVQDNDVPNKKLILSTRPSQTLSSSLPIEDPNVESVDQVKTNSIQRGFIKNVAANGIFVALSSRVTAFIRVADLSDLYLKDWKAEFEVDQLVRGKIILVDTASGHILMSLKQSHLDKDYKPPLTFNDVYEGQIVTGKVRKVEDFGVFVVFDESANVSGLCHRSEMSDRPKADPRKLYDEGDLVKVKVLHIDREKRRISLGLKTSYIEEGDQDIEAEAVEIGEVDDSNDDELVDDIASNDLKGVHLPHSKDDVGESGLIYDTEEIASISDASGEPNTLQSHIVAQEALLGDSSPFSELKGLSTGGFDWTGAATFSDHEGLSDSSVASVPKKKKRRKPTVPVDRTGDLDANGPQSTADFERRLLGQPNNSLLWLQYMEFYINLGEIEIARTIAERGLRTIHIREQDQKFNIWMGLLNLEDRFGTDERLEDAFKRACESSDSFDVSQKLISIYIQSQKHGKADDLFQTTLQKHQEARQNPDFWLNYFQFLMTTLASPDRARNALSERAYQALPRHTHLDLTKRFAKLEFESSHGDAERGRTIFETLVSEYPKRADLWNVFIDAEIKKGEVERARSLFSRATRIKTLKPRQAKFFFKRWSDYEDKHGGANQVQKVTGLAQQWASDYEQSKRGKETSSA